jgi:hypothetical protein
MAGCPAGCWLHKLPSPASLCQLPSSGILLHVVTSCVLVLQLQLQLKLAHRIACWLLQQLLQYAWRTWDLAQRLLGVLGCTGVDLRLVNVVGTDLAATIASEHVTGYAQDVFCVVVEAAELNNQFVEHHTSSCCGQLHQSW